MSEQHSTSDVTAADSTAATTHDTEAARGRRQASPFVAVAVGAVILGAGSAVTVQAFASDGHPTQTQSDRGMGRRGGMGAPGGMAGRTGMPGGGMPGSGTQGSGAQGAPGAQAAPGGVQQNPAPGA